MNTQQRGILTLLKSAVTGVGCELPEGFSLEDALPTIRAHSLSTLACEGAALCGISDCAATEALYNDYCAELLRSEKQLRAVKEICAAFEEAGVDYMPLKGCNLKQLYPRPELRCMGDADILVRMAQEPVIHPIMERLGYTREKESDHEYVWLKPGVTIELHKRLIPSYNADFYGYFGDGWQLAEKTVGCRWDMRREDEFIFLFTHYAKHYRDGGVGCRHVLDLWVWQRSYPDMDTLYVETRLETLGLLEFYRNTCRLLDFWFGGAGGDDRTEFMTDFLFGSGNWGNWETHVLSAQVKERKLNHAYGQERRRTLIRLLFPTVEVLATRYPIVKKAPWLTPAVWVFRWVDAALFRRQNVRKKRRDLSGIAKPKVDAHQAALEFVGLDFRTS